MGDDTTITGIGRPGRLTVAAIVASCAVAALGVLPLVGAVSVVL